MTRLLSRLLGATPRNPRPTELALTLYTREACPCCHKALDTLRGFQRRYGFTLELVDVDGDPELIERHGNWVPVVAAGGKVRFRGKLNPILLERLLEASARETIGAGPDR